VYSPVNGFVQSVRYLPGDYVRKGQLLAVLSHPDLVRLQRAFLESRSRLGALERDFERKKTLAQADATSQRALEQAQADYEMELAHNKGLRAEIDLIGLSAQQLDQGGEIQSTLAVRAPVSGYVNQVNLNIGKLVTPDDLLYEIIDVRHVHLELQVYARDLDKLRVDQRIEAWMPGVEKRYAAKVHLIGRMIDPDTKTTLVHGHFDAEPVAITPGAFMHAHIFTDEATAQVVPETALVREGEKTYLFVYRDGAFEKRSVTTGRADGDYVEIEDLALNGDERVAVRGWKQGRGLILNLRSTI
jgi:cobalt-zinc-cadmium efflux system membrane fusion protein